MSPVGFEKRLCRPVGFKVKGPPEPDSSPQKECEFPILSKRGQSHYSHEIYINPGKASRHSGKEINDLSRPLPIIAHWGKQVVTPNTSTLSLCTDYPAPSTHCAGAAYQGTVDFRCCPDVDIYFRSARCYTNTRSLTPCAAQK